MIKMDRNDAILIVGIALVLILPLGWVLALANAYYPQVPTVPGIKYVPSENVPEWGFDVRVIPLSQFSLLPMRTLSTGGKTLVIAWEYIALELVGIFVLAYGVYLRKAS
jgi:hypothetical protein